MLPKTRVITGYLSFHSPQLEDRLLKEGHCQTVVSAPKGLGWFDEFITFLDQTEADEIVTINLESTGVRLLQWPKVTALLEEKDLSFRFLDTHELSHAHYLQVLTSLIVQEKQLVYSRTCFGLSQAKAKGVIGGRPTVKESTIQRIRELSATQKKSQREISALCGVSIGTVNKYVNQFNPSQKGSRD